MNFFPSLSIRSKIIAIVVFVVALQLAASGIALYSLGAVNSKLSLLVDVDAQKIRLAKTINIDLLEIHRAGKNLILAPGKEDLERFSRHMVRYKDDLDRNLVELERLANDEELALIKEFKKRTEEFLSIYFQIESLVSSDWQSEPGNALEAPRFFNTRAVSLSIGEGRKAFAAASEIMSELGAKADSALGRSKSLGYQYLETALFIVAGFSVTALLLGLLVGILMARSIANSLGAMVKIADSIAAGHLDTPVDIGGSAETGKLAASVKHMQSALLRARDEVAERDWIKTGIARLNDAMRGKLTLNELCTHVVAEVATYLGAPVGALFLADDAPKEASLALYGGYAYPVNSGSSRCFAVGEGLVGQSALEKRPIIIQDIPDDYIKVVCGLGEACPRCILVTPLLHDGAVKGVLELGFLRPMTDLQKYYLERVTPAIAVNIESAQSREELSVSLAHSRALTEELQAQQQKLQRINEELHAQAQQLRQSEEELRAQQEELEATNEELQQKNQMLELHRAKIEQANKELEQSQRDLETKAEELALAGKYKSEFLANMSHELRTPLNSMLLLSKLLSENREGHLTEEQVKSLEIIHNSGNDLLLLINDILDLSRIEAGRMNLHVKPVRVREIAQSIEENFRHMTDEKALRLDIVIAEDCPEELETDRQRLDQIIRNLLSNALKFTREGGITVTFKSTPSSDGKKHQGPSLSISVHDTGMGIPLDKQKIIFEAFQQLDSGTTRKYGGTGLGLSISRELAKMLGGTITLESEEGKGSTFTVVLPLQMKRSGGSGQDAPVGSSAVERVIQAGPRPQRHPYPVEPVVDDRENISEGDKTILIVDDDLRFAGQLVKLCRSKGFKCLAAPTGEEGLTLARKYLPGAVMLDLHLPGIDGWSVLEELKSDPNTRHIPVHILSVEEPGVEVLMNGAVGYLTKPVSKEDLDTAIGRLEDISSRKLKDLLVVEDDESLRKSIIQLIGNGDVRSDEARTGQEAIDKIKSRRFDCMILDLGLPDMDGLEVLRSLAAERADIPPVIVYTGKDLSREQIIELRRFSESIIIKGALSEERLLDEASLFLHRMVSNMPEQKRRVITNLHDADLLFKGKQVLIVDDDMRNVFALSRVLEEKRIITIKAHNGEKALQVLEENPEVDLVLMDIMMPGMDGYETIRRIRAQERFRTLPIIALTAKAMPKDREHCIQAGASDYLAKPVDIGRLFSIMRVWLY